MKLLVCCALFSFLSVYAFGHIMPSARNTDLALGLKRRLSMSFRSTRPCILITPLTMLISRKSFGAARRPSDQAAI